MNQQMQDARQEELALFNDEITQMIEATLAELEERSRAAHDSFTLSALCACRAAMAQERQDEPAQKVQIMFDLAIMEDMLQMPDLTLAYPEMLPESFAVEFRMYRLRTRQERTEKIRQAILAM